MTAPANPAADPEAAREIVSTRVLTAPREAVYRAFSDPSRLAQWWGPKGFTSNMREFDLRPGGSWRFTMHGPDGAAYEMDKQFVEVLPRECIVVRHFQQSHDFLLTMTFAERGDRTELTWRLRFDDPAEFTKVKAFIVSANEENFDRLEAHLRQSA